MESTKYEGIMPQNKNSDEEIRKVYFYMHKTAQLLDNFAANDNNFF